MWNVKEATTINAPVVIQVLIETLWNVKKAEEKPIDIEAMVLIETLWNVKGMWMKVDRSIILSINRNIVECKERRVFFMREQFIVLIETLWNVKM